MSEQKQKRPAHEVILEEMDLALRRMRLTMSKLGNSVDEDAACELIRVKSSFQVLLQILGKTEIPENKRQWVIEKLNGLVDVDRRPEVSLFGDIQSTIKQL